ncbi:MAG: TolC family protein [Pirellulaceae bacterium]
MEGRHGIRIWQWATMLWAGVSAWAVPAEWPLPLFLPEQRSIEVRQPSELPSVPIPRTPPPPTIVHNPDDLPIRTMSLDDAIRSALIQAEVIRVLAGVAAVSSGSTIYDVAAANTANDQARARFDPTVQVLNSWNRTESPQAVFADPALTTSRIEGLRSDNYNVDANLSKTLAHGGTASLNLSASPTTLRPGVFPLNPSTRSAAELSLTQPLLRGGGLRTNLAPLVIARINTERSYFQFKDSVQEMVRGVIEAYWAVVFARTDVWARGQQVRQAEFAFEQAQAKMELGIVNIGEVAQTRTALANFRAALVSSRAGLLQREAALRNILGLPPYDPEQLVPVTPPLQARMEPDWEEILSLAEQNRPDLIELKLILEADEQQLYQARNNALPQLDAVALYRWNGLEGEMPIGASLSTDPGQFTDWTLAVNFSVPLGLRQSRAALRNQELVISRDRANLQQGLHAVAHELALTMRNLAQFYEQYVAYTELRAAADENLSLQLNRFRVGQVTFLVVLQAITDWGNAVSAQAQTLLQYNSELANLERRTGTILETHGIAFYEERYGSIGPLGRLHPGVCYPMSLPPTGNTDRYEQGTEPAENAFQLADPVRRIPER